jgi:hypothetical protein
MLGSAVAITVESVFSMNRAVATVRGTIQSGFAFGDGIGQQTRSAPGRLHGGAAISHGRVSRLYPQRNRGCIVTEHHLLRGWSNGYVWRERSSGRRSRHGAGRETLDAALSEQAPFPVADRRRRRAHVDGGSLRHGAAE